jgi:RNA polymerase sigma-70 factor (ECF subfamily)
MAEVTREERALVDRARRGDAAAFDALVRAHADAVFRLCARHAPPADAEELAQEAFLRAFVHREKLDPDLGVRTWLLSVAHRLCIDRFRTRRDFEPVDDARPAPAVDLDARLDARTALGRVDRAMAKLPPGQREALALYHLEGLAYADVARTLGVPVGTVMSWLHRGREKLRAALEEAA